MSFFKVTLCILPLPLGNSNSSLPSSLAASAAKTNAFSSMSDSSSISFLELLSFLKSSASIFPFLLASIFFWLPDSSSSILYPHCSQTPSDSSSSLYISLTSYDSPLTFILLIPFSYASMIASTKFLALPFFISLFSSISSFSPISSNLSIISDVEVCFIFSIINSFSGCFFL